MFKIKLDFANICLSNFELDEIQCCFIFCEVWELFCVSTSHKTIVQNSFSDFQHYTHHRKPHSVCFLSQKTFSVAFTWNRNIDCILPKWQRCRPRSDYPEQHCPFQSQVTGLLKHTKFRLQDRKVWQTSCIWINPAHTQEEGLQRCVLSYLPSWAKYVKIMKCFPRNRVYTPNFGLKIRIVLIFLPPL